MGISIYRVFFDIFCDNFWLEIPRKISKIINGIKWNRSFVMECIIHLKGDVRSGETKDNTLSNNATNSHK